MSITIELSHNPMQTCELSLSEAASEGGATAWLLPDYARALAARKSLAKTKSPLRFGCTVSSFGSWIEDLWALYGDGRALVSSVQRKLLMEDAITPAGESFFPTNQGTIDLLGRMVETGMGLSDFLNPPHLDLSPTEQGMLKAARNYRELLEKHGLCEASEAMLLLSQRADIAWPRIAATGFDKLRLHEAAFFAAISSHTDIRFVAYVAQGSRFDSGEMLAEALNQALNKMHGEGERILLVKNLDLAAKATNTGDASCSSAGPSKPSTSDASRASSADAAPDELASLRAALYYPNPNSPLVAGGSVRTLLPAGRYAQAALLLEAIRTLSGSVLIACNQPYEMFTELAPRLHAHNINVEGNFTRRFAETDFGGAFLNALALAKSDQPSPAQASDFAFSLFAGIDLQKAYEADASWRGSRLTKREDILRTLRDIKPSAANFVSLLEAGRYTDALETAEARFKELAGEGEAFRAEQFASSKCVRTLVAEAESLGRDPRSLFHLLERMQLRSGACIVSEGASAQVTIVSHRDAAALPERSYDHVFACNLNASEQSLRQNRNSTDELFEHLGYESGDDALFTARLRMARLIDCARSRLYLVRSLHNEKTEPTYPAVVFEDVVDCYRGLVADDKGKLRIEGLSKVTALTAALEAFALSRGEEKLEANLYPAAVLKASVPQGAYDKISRDTLPLLCGPLAPASRPAANSSPTSSKGGHANAETPLQMSPSAIESYLDCPHKWFANNRLHLGEVDAALSLRESGTLIHEVLFKYYHRLQIRLGTTKPKPDQMAQAETILEEEFERTLAAQAQKSLRDNPYIPLTQAEHKQTQAILNALKGFIKRDSQFAPEFKPTHFELKFGYNEPFEYAGVLLRGSIDRIDIDEKGRAIIVDYKSSLSSSYKLLASSKEGVFALPPKVQTLIYAQVARRLLKLNVVGALYLHTQRASKGKPLVCGAYDDRLLSSDDLLKISSKGSALSESPFSSFEALLDEVEGLIAERVEQLKQGAIEVNPLSEKACSFCPVISCERRS